jgi:ornithine carbamoyltransferase
MTAKRHFLTLNDISAAECRALIARATELKQWQREGVAHAKFPGKVLAMIFAKASTRTRVSFEAGIVHLGGSAMFLSSQDTQLGRGEPIEDSARVISSMVDMVMIRTFEHSIVERFAAQSSAPVINGLTDDYHPCQLLADLQTYFEHRGDISGKRVCWLGDGNNMCQSYINAARLLDFELVVSCPQGFEPDADLVAKHPGHIVIEHDPQRAARDANLLVTDVWASMGQEKEQQARAAAMAPYQLNSDLLSEAATDALYMHCLPAHRGEEITAELMDAADSVIWDEAENRLHAQKALMEFLFEHNS